MAAQAYACGSWMTRLPRDCTRNDISKEQGLPAMLPEIVIKRTIHVLRVV